MASGGSVVEDPTSSKGAEQVPVVGETETSGSKAQQKSRDGVEATAHHVDVVTDEIKHMEQLEGDRENEEGEEKMREEEGGEERKEAVEAPVGEKEEGEKERGDNPVGDVEREGEGEEEAKEEEGEEEKEEVEEEGEEEGEEEKEEVEEEGEEEKEEVEEEGEEEKEEVEGESVSVSRRRRRDVASSESEGETDKGNDENAVSEKALEKEDEVETEGDGGWVEREGEGEDGGWEEGEGEDGGEGEGEGDTETSPMFVPKKGVFFQHDVRYMSGEDEEQEKSGEENTVVQTRADTVEKWGHDLYIETEQGPRQQWEKEKDVKHYAELEKRREQRSKGGGGKRTMGDYFSSWEGGSTDRGRGGRGRARGARGVRGAHRRDGERGGERRGEQTDEGRRGRREGRPDDEERTTSKRRVSEHLQKNRDTEKLTPTGGDWGEEEESGNSQQGKVRESGRKEESESDERGARGARRGRDRSQRVRQSSPRDPGASKEKRTSQQVSLRPSSIQEPPEVDTVRGFQSKTFSLTSDKRLVVSSDPRASSSQVTAGVGGRGGGRGRGRGRGRGNVKEGGNSSKVGVPQVIGTRSPPSDSVKVSTEKEPSPVEQFADAVEDDVVSEEVPSGTTAVRGAARETEVVETQETSPQATSVPASKPKRYSTQRQQQRTGQEVAAEDPTLGHQHQPATNMRSFQDAPKHLPLQPPILIAAPSPIPPGMSVHTSQPEHSFQPAIVPTSQGQIAAAGPPVDWGQFQMQMQMLNQQNPAFFEQMQQFFWSQSVALQHHQMQQLQQLQSQHYHQLPQPMQPGQVQSASPADFRQFGSATGEYNIVSFPAPSSQPPPQPGMNQKGGGGPAQYVQSTPSGGGGGLFIPPMTHLPPLPTAEEAGETPSQPARRSLAIPIVPPKE